MSANLQIDLAVLDSLVINQTQKLFNSTCLPSNLVTSLFLDGVDVQGISRTVNSDHIVFIITAEALVATQAALDASIGLSGGPDDEVFTITIAIELRVEDVPPPDFNMPTGRALKFILVGTESTDAEVQLAANTLIPPMTSLGTVDLTPIFTLLTIIPRDVVFETVEPSGLFIWLTPPTTIVNHLGQYGVQWCLYVDATAVANMITTSLRIAIEPQLAARGALISQAVSEWLPEGLGAPLVPIPHVASYIQANGVEVVSYEVDANFKVDLSLEADVGQLIQLINWGIDINTPDFFDPIFSAIAQDIADNIRDDIVAKFNPATIPGGSRVGEVGTNYGDHNFQITSDLPSISFGTSSFSYNYCVGFSDGMMLGGIVDAGPGVSAGYTSFTPTPFPVLYDSLLDCKTQKILSTVIRASAISSPDFSIGTFCEAIITAPSIPGLDLSPFLSSDALPSETNVEGVTVFVIFPSVVAFQVASNKQNVVVRISTTRGVRMVDLGVPPVPQFDQSGQITNTSTTLLNDCMPAGDLWRQPHSITAVAWPFKPAVAWVDRPDRVAAFESALITVNPSSGPVIFKQPRDGGITIIHGSKEGKYVIPTLLAVRSYDEGGSLETMDRSNLGKVTIQSKLFRRVAQFRKSESISHQLVGNKRIARIVSTFEDGVEETDVDISGLMRQAARKHSSNSSQLEKVKEKKQLPSIAGCIALHPVPGYEDQSTSIAELADGSFRVVSHTDGGYEVTGFLPRWIRGLTVSGDWAISTTKCGKVTVFQVHETNKKDCTCQCKCGGKEAKKL